MKENNRKENTAEERNACLTTNQKHRLLLFVEQHYSALFERSSISDDLIKGKLWEALTVQLNCMGPKNNESGWRRLFICYKSATRLKLKHIEAKRVPVEKLNDTDFRIMKMCRMDTYGIDLNLMSQVADKSYTLVAPAVSTKNSGFLTHENEISQSVLQSNNSNTSNQQSVRTITINDFIAPDFPENDEEKAEQSCEELNIKPQSKKKSIDSRQHEKGRKLESHEEAKVLEKRYSKHRDSNSFRQAEAQKQNKRDHPVNSIESNLIDVNQMFSNIAQTPKKADDANEENEPECLPKNRQPSKIPKIIKKHRKRQSGQITKYRNYDETGTANLKTKIDIKQVLPLRSIPLQMKNQTKKTLQTETFGGKKKDNIDNVGKRDSQNGTVLQKTSKYHSNCTTTHTKTPETTNLNKKIGIKKAPPLKFLKSMPLQMKNKPNETTKTEAGNGETVGNAKDNLSAANTSERIEFEKNRDNLMSLVKQYHTTYMTNEDNTKEEASEKTVEFRQISENDSVENASGNDDKVNDPLSKQSKGSKSTKSRINRKPAKTFGQKWIVESVENELTQIHTKPLTNSKKDKVYMALRNSTKFREPVSQSIIKPASTSSGKEPALLSQYKFVSQKTGPLQQKHIYPPKKTASATITKEQYLKQNGIPETENQDPCGQPSLDVPFQVDMSKNRDVSLGGFDGFANLHVPAGNKVLIDPSKHSEGVIKKRQVNILENVSIEPTSASTPLLTGMNFEERVLRELSELKKEQQKAEDKRVIFETRMEVKWDVFVKGTSQNQGQNQNKSQEPDLVVDENDDFEDLDVHFPITVLENVDELNWSVQNDIAFKRRMRNRLDDLAGNSPEASIRLKMRYLISDPVLERYSWCGTVETKKKAFKDLVALNNLVFHSVQGQFSSYKKLNYKNYMVNNWLKHARTRQRTVTYQYPKRRRDDEFGDFEEVEEEDEENEDDHDV